MTIRMIRDDPVFPGGPVEADVHPDEVDNWSAAGWRMAESEKKEKETAASPSPGRQKRTDKQ